MREGFLTRQVHHGTLTRGTPANLPGAEIEREWGNKMKLILVATGLCLTVLAAAPSKEVAVVLPRDTVCGKNIRDAALVQRAIDQSDKEALVSLVEKGRALYLKKATRVIYTDFQAVPGMIFVAVRSGSEIGESCFMPKRWVVP
jgi:hypothetical protein